MYICIYIYIYTHIDVLCDAARPSSPSLAIQLMQRPTRFYCYTRTVYSATLIRVLDYPYALLTLYNIPCIRYEIRLTV